MHKFNLSLRILLSMLAALALTACSKTVQWEEEVPLNTGEVIWVKRTDTFAKEMEGGGNMGITWGLDKRAYEFSWQGKHYTYQTEPKVSLGAILIYVFPADKTIAIVDATRNCTKPGYGEFRWTNGGWNIQENVSPTLIGQPRNLMSHYSADIGDIPARVTKEIRHAEDTTANRGKIDLSLEPSRISTNCSGKN